MAELTPKEILTRYCKAMEIGADECIALMHDDIVLYAPCVPAPVPKTMTGLEAVGGAYKMLFARLFKQFRWSGEIFATDNPEVAVARMSSRVELMDGRQYANEYMLLSRVRDGKLCEHHEFFDSERATEAFGDLLSGRE